MENINQYINEKLKLTINGFSEDVSIPMIRKFAEEILNGVDKLEYVKNIRVTSENDRCTIHFGSIKYDDNDNREQSYRDIEKCIDTANKKVFKDSTFDYELGGKHKISKWGIYNYHIYPTFMYMLNCTTINHAQICSTWLTIYCEYDKYHDVFKEVFDDYKK